MSICVAVRGAQSPARRRVFRGGLTMKPNLRKFLEALLKALLALLGGMAGGAMV